MNGEKGRHESSNTNEVKAISPPKQFLNHGKSLLKVLNELLEKNLIHLLPLKNLKPNTNPNLYHKFHQHIGHNTDRCIRLRHAI